MAVLCGVAVVGVLIIVSVGMRKKAVDRAGLQISPVHIRLRASDRTRLKHICVDLGMTYEAFLLDAMERHDRRTQRAGAVARSPLHDVGEDFDE